MDDDKIYHLLEFFQSEHDDDILNFDLHILRYWIVVAPSSKFYTVCTVLFHKYGGKHFAFTNYMSHFYMFSPTKANVKLANENTGHAQVIGIVLYQFLNCHIIYPVVPVYYFPGHSSNNISTCDFKYYIVFQKVTSEPLEHCDFVDPQGCSWRSPY